MTQSDPASSSSSARLYMSILPASGDSTGVLTARHLTFQDFRGSRATSRASHGDSPDRPGVGRATMRKHPEKYWKVGFSGEKCRNGRILRVALCATMGKRPREVREVRASGANLALREGVVGQQVAGGAQLESLAANGVAFFLSWGASQRLEGRPISIEQPPTAWEGVQLELSASARRASAFN